MNLMSGKHALGRETKVAVGVDRIKEVMCITAISALAIGIALIAVFGAINVPSHKIRHGEVSMMENNENVKNGNKKSPGGAGKSISYGQTGPAQSSQVTQKPAENPNTNQDKKK